MTGSALYREAMDWYAANQPDRSALMHEVWDGTPFMVDAFTGSYADDRFLEMIEWCRQRFGDEAWPIHGRAGAWLRGSSTINGWTWYGFATAEHLAEFEAAWPAPPDAKKPGAE